MKLNKIIIIFTLFAALLCADGLSIDDEAKLNDLLPHAEIYIDKTKSLTIKEILENNASFAENNKKLLGFGYSPDFNVWIKFTLENFTDKSIDKILEYDNPLTAHVNLYQQSTGYLRESEGLFHLSGNRKTLNPIFHISLNPHESKTYYVQASSEITTLILKLHLWQTNSFYEKEIMNQVVLGLFFGAMLILALYNMFIFLFTKDMSYLFYVLYIIGITLHHFLYIGFGNIYLLNSEWIIQIMQFASLIVGFPALALALFTKSFLQTKQYPLLNKLLNMYLIFFLFILSIFMLTDAFNKYRNIFSVILLLYLVALTVYAALKKNRQAYFVLFGWLVILSAAVFMYLSSIGSFDIFTLFPHYVELSLVGEAIIFSIALADRIKQLQKDKEDVGNKLLAQQKDEKKKLELKVSEKTNDLKVTLDEKILLLKELNHRVKNNMQTIVSLIRLQSETIEDEKLQELFLSIQNRINAMSHLHELLYKKDDISHVNAYEYFTLLIEDIRDSYDRDVTINFDIKTDLKMEQAIYCGLILNELISNSFKHAFVDTKGTITIKLSKEEKLYKLNVCDNGIGYKESEIFNTLGLTLLNTLAKEQLKGIILTDTIDGVKVEITWSTHD